MRREKSKFPFQQKVTNLILSLGATIADSGIYKYQIKTSCGTLFVTPKDIWIATRFNEPERVPKHLQINRFSGKWNFHPEEPDQSWVDFFEQQLATIGVKERNPT